MISSCPILSTHKTGKQTINNIIITTKK